MKCKGPVGYPRGSGAANNEVDRARKAAGITATVHTVIIVAAEAAEMASSAGARNPAPPKGGTRKNRRNEASMEGGAAGRDSEIARLKQPALGMTIRMEVQGMQI